VNEKGVGIKMITILVANQKGGVGKTTIADELSFAFERLGHKVCFQNLDPQGGVIHNPSIPDDEDFRVVDTPGVLTEKFHLWCRESDIIIMPTTASMLDLVPLQRCYELATGSKTKAAIGFVVNNYDPRRTVDRQFMKFLSNASMDVWGTIPTATAIRQAQARRTSVAELSKNSPATTAFDMLAASIAGKFLATAA
jgi:chromosome partitioning protein